MPVAIRMAVAGVAREKKSELTDGLATPTIKHRAKAAYILALVAMPFGRFQSAHTKFNVCNAMQGYGGTL